MKKNTLLCICAVIVLALTFSSCGKSKNNDVTPTTKGGNGNNGNHGNGGTKSEYDTLIISSFTVRDYTFHTQDSSYYAHFDQEEIAAYGKDNVKLYLEIYYPSTKTWMPLPDRYEFTSFNGFINEFGGFDIKYSDIDGYDPGYPDTYTFRGYLLLKVAHKGTPYHVIGVMNAPVQGIDVLGIEHHGIARRSFSKR